MIVLKTRKKNLNNISLIEDSLYGRFQSYYTFFYLNKKENCLHTVLNTCSVNKCQSGVKKSRTHGHLKQW